MFEVVVLTGSWVVVVIVYLTSYKSYGARTKYAYYPHNGHQRSPGAS